MKTFAQTLVLTGSLVTGLIPVVSFAEPSRHLIIPVETPREQMIQKFLKGLGLDLTPEQREQIEGAVEQLKKSGTPQKDSSAEPSESTENDAEAEAEKSAKPQANEGQTRRRARITPAQPHTPPQAAAPDAQETPADEDEGPGPAPQLQLRLNDLLRQMMGGGGNNGGGSPFGPNSPFGRLFGGEDSEDEGTSENPLDQLFKNLPQGGNHRPGGWQEMLEQMQGGGAQAQEQKRSFKYEKAHRSVLAEYRPIVKEARDSTVVIYRGGEQIALGTIVTADGYALTKASEVGERAEIEAEFQDGHTVPAKVVDRLKDYDLALIKIEATGLKPVTWSTQDSPVGTLLAASGVDENPLAIGVISVLPRNLDSTKRGFLGVTLDAAPGGVVITREPGKDFNENGQKTLADKLPAVKAGLRMNDVITAVDGKPMRSPSELTHYISSKKAGDEVHVQYQRNAEDKVAVVELGSRAEFMTHEQAGKKDERRQFDQTAMMGRKMSRVADDFPMAMENDLLIDGNECGGPVLNLDGQAIGMNIAVSERTKTYAIPAAALKEILTDVATGKLHEPKDRSDLKREVRQADTQIEELDRQLEELKASKRKKEEALSKQNGQ
jgi:serine protease Do